MALIEIPLNKYTYRFKRLTWAEESRLKFPAGEDQRRIIMARALVEVSGLALTPDQAATVIRQVPEAVFWRLWVLYRADLPAERYYSSGGLYEAPDQVAYRKQLLDENTQTEQIADAASAQITHKYGHREAQDAENVTAHMFRQAKNAGLLVPAGKDSHG